MTRKEKINQLNDIFAEINEDDYLTSEDKIIEWKKDFKEYINALSMPRDDYKGIMEYIDELPIVSVQPKYNTSEWCHDCKEYDHDKHCCPRFNNVIRNAVEEMKQPKTGHWIYGENEYGIDGYHCDKCGFFVPWDYAHKFINYIKDYKFCPKCNARMVEPQESEETDADID